MNKELIKFAGEWKGDDLNDMLNLVYATRSKTKWYAQFKKQISFTSLIKCKQKQ